MKWFRWHHDTCEDAKFRMVARVTDVTVRDVIALWAALLEGASRGVTRNAGVTPVTEESVTRNGERCNALRGTVTRDRLAFIESVLDLPSDLMGRMCSAMEDAKLIETSEFSLRILNWGKRQFDTDLRDGTNAERQRRYRERKRARNGKQNGTVTPQIQITDTESDTESERVESAQPKAAPTGKGTRFSIDALPDDWKRFCIEKRPDLDPSATFDRCRDYWIAQPGQRGVKRDWDATWRNWVRNEKARAGPRPKLPDPFLERLEREIAEDKARESQRSDGGPPQKIPERAA